MTHPFRQKLTRARAVSPAAIRGNERPAEIIAEKFPAYVGRNLRLAYELMHATVERRAATFLTLSGAMTPAGLHASCLIPLIERGLIDVVTTTGANLYHDAHRVIGHAVREIDPNAGDLAMRKARIIRIYDLAFPEEALLDTDRLFSAIISKPRFQKRMTTPEFHRLLGEELAGLEEKLGVKQPSLLATAYRHDVPIFVGAVQDGSIFLNVVKLKALGGDEFRCEIDPVADVFEMAAVQHYCQEALERPLAVWMLGGGVPKNYTLQGEPLLSQILGVPTPGFDIDVQICVDVSDNGALSGASAAEGHTWGKTTAESVERGSVYCRTDVTVAMPWLTYALLSDPKMRKPALRLSKKLAQANALLQGEVKRRRKKLEKSLSFPAVDRPAARR
jgi:deoxyhypusine synthase